jgi:hypothetical protein
MVVRPLAGDNTLAITAESDCQFVSVNSVVQSRYGSVRNSYHRSSGDIFSSHGPEPALTGGGSRLRIPNERWEGETAKVATDIAHSGNTSAASITLALTAMISQGEISSGAPVLLLGFGARLCYAAQVITTQ